MADQLPTISGNRAVNAGVTPSTSLLGRGLAAIQSGKLAESIAFDEEKFFSVLCRVMHLACEIGYLTFKENARYVLDEMRERVGDAATKLITIDHLQAAYIGMKKGTTSKKEVVNIESIDELYLDEEIFNADIVKRYRQARDIYNRITDDGNQDCTGNCWTDEELAELSDAFETFQDLADTGYSKAYFPLSQLYRGGQSVPENQMLAKRYGHFAFNWCFDNQLQNDPEIWNDLGTLYRLGNIVETGYTLALYWYRQAAGAGDATGMFNVSSIYEFGIGVEEDYEEALDWQFAAAKAGHTTAQYGIGCQYEHGGCLLEQDDELAFYWYLQAAERGNRKARCSVAQHSWVCFGFPEDDDLAFDWYLVQAKAGEVWAQWFLAEAYMKGLGIEEDYYEAAYWYREAAEQGHANAQNNLGFMYANGRGVAQNDEQAVFWYRKSAEQGDSNGQLLLGWMYKIGCGVTQDDEQVVFWWRKAAEQGHVSAQCHLGGMYGNGLGVVQNDEQAVFWLRKAAEQDDAEAQETLTNLGINRNDT